ncbi:MAG: amidinotransferase [Bacteroidetes bacterium]|nr:MAG: amidinotransferase [Bacteroidota bacterium]
MNLIVSPPGPAYFNVTDLARHNITKPTDPELAAQQHLTLVKTLEQTGCGVIYRPELPGHPNSVFTKDPIVCTPRGYIILRMGLPSRMGEELWMAEFLDKAGIPCIGSIRPPGTVEGGDVILAGKIAFLGRSTRTNRAGVRQIGDLLEKVGFEIRTAAVPAPFLHVGGAVSLVSPDTLLCVKGLFPDSFLDGFQRIEVPNTGFINGNVISAGNRSVVAELSNQPAIEALRRHQYSVYPVDLSEFVKGTGGPSCLILEVKYQLAIGSWQ